MAPAVADPKDVGKAKAGPKRPAKERGNLSKREIERRRARTRRLFVPLAAVAVAATAVAAAVVFAGPQGPPPNEELCGPPPLMHTHAHLQIFNGGAPLTIPDNVGRVPENWKVRTWDSCVIASEGKIAPLHTHASDLNGRIHIESVGTRNWTLGEFFQIWGQPIGPSQVWNLRADSSHRLSMVVDGVPTGAWGSLLLTHDELNEQQIEIHFDPI